MSLRVLKHNSTNNQTSGAGGKAPAVSGALVILTAALNILLKLRHCVFPRSILTPNHDETP